jgi:hypothetical protein
MLIFGMKKGIAFFHKNSSLDYLRVEIAGAARK